MNQMELSFKTRQKEHVRLEFESNSRNEEFARVVAAVFMSRLDPTLEETQDVKTAVSEAVTNAIIHGYQNNPECKVIIKVTIEDNRQIKIIIQDYGKGIEDIDEAKIPMYTSLKELEHAGMGLTIIEALCDNLEIHSTPDLGTKLTIKKQLKDSNLG